jgi:hypothetical protein
MVHGVRRARRWKHALLTVTVNVTGIDPIPFLLRPRLFFSGLAPEFRHVR